MKITVLAASLAVVAAPLAVAAVPAAAEEAKAEAALTIDTPIETLMADEDARAVVLESLPDLDQHPAYGQFKALSLKAVQPFSQGMITDEMLANIAAGLAKLN